MVGPEIAKEIFNNKEILDLIFMNFPAVALAFSLAIRKIIGRRDEWRCQHPECDKSFATGWNVDAAHYDHDKDNPYYDDPDNGRILCLDHHEEEHREGAEGLDRDENDWAADKIAGKIRGTRWWLVKNPQAVYEQVAHKQVVHEKVL